MPTFLQNGFPLNQTKERFTSSSLYLGPSGAFLLLTLPFLAVTGSNGKSYVNYESRELQLKHGY